jgi:hypothetical protein
MEQPAKARYRIESEGSVLRLIIPSRKHWFIIFFFGFWSIFWLFLTIGVLSTMVSGFLISAKDASQLPAGFLFPGLFLLVWLVLWIGGGLFAVYTWLWQLIGHEIVEVGPGSISITRKTLGFERPKTYDAAYIKALRVFPYQPQTGWPGGYNRQMWTRNTGTLAFDYGAKTIRFGDMDEAEAKMALADILQRYPSFGRQEQK